MSPMNKTAGFTLIEVLVALAILSIALTAIIKATSQNIKNTLYLQEKTISAWVGTKIITETRLGIIKLPAPPDVTHKQTHMFNQVWPWQAHLSITPNRRIRKITVEVFAPKNQRKLITLESYLYDAP